MGPVRKELRIFVNTCQPILLFLIRFYLLQLLSQTGNGQGWISSGCTFSWQRFTQVYGYSGMTAMPYVTEATCVAGCFSTPSCIISDFWNGQSAGTVSCYFGQNIPGSSVSYSYTGSSSTIPDHWLIGRTNQMSTTSWQQYYNTTGYSGMVYQGGFTLEATCLAACFATPTCIMISFFPSSSAEAGCWFGYLGNDPTVMSYYEGCIHYVINKQCSEDLLFENVAYQSSTIGSYMANLAVDGGTSVSLSSGSCCCTGATSEIMSWWAVDMGKNIQLIYINITTTNVQGFPLSNFNVGVTNINPSVVAPTLGSYSLCAYYPNTAPASSTTSVSCKTNVMFARYLIIQLTTANTSLALCEVEVFTSAQSLYTEFKCQYSSRMANSSTTIALTVSSAFQCLLICVNSLMALPAAPSTPVNCDSFNYRPLDMTCEINTHSGYDVISNDYTWELWQPTYYVH